MGLLTNFQNVVKNLSSTIQKAVGSNATVKSVTNFIKQNPTPAKLIQTKVAPIVTKAVQPTKVSLQTFVKSPTATNAVKTLQKLPTTLNTKAQSTINKIYQAPNVQRAPTILKPFVKAISTVQSPARAIAKSVLSDVTKTATIGTPRQQKLRILRDKRTNALMGKEKMSDEEQKRLRELEISDAVDLMIGMTGGGSKLNTEKALARSYKEFEHNLGPLVGRAGEKFTRRELDTAINRLAKVPLTEAIDEFTKKASTIARYIQGVKSGVLQNKPGGMGLNAKPLRSIQEAEQAAQKSKQVKIPPRAVEQSNLKTVQKSLSDHSSPLSIPQPFKEQTLNVKNLKLTPEQQAHVQSLESTEIRRKLGDKTILDIAKKSGLDTKTYTIDETAKKIGEQLNIRKNIVTLENQLEELKKTNAPITQVEDVIKQIADNSRISRTQGTDLARQLRARKILANELDTPMQRIFKILEDNGINPDKFTKEAAKIDFTNPQEVVDFYRRYAPAKAKDWVDVIRYNSMLSSPLTHIVNTASNLYGGGVVAPIEKTIAGTLDFIGSKLSGKPRKLFAGEGPEYLKGYTRIQNIQKAAHRFADVMKDKSLTTNLDVRDFPLATKGSKKAVEDILRTPMKLLEGMDQFFSTLTESGEKAALTYRQSKGVSVPDLAGQATKNAQYRLFRQKLFSPNQGELLDGVDRLTQKLMELRNAKEDWVKNIAKFTLPFVQTPMNIFKQGLEYSPAGLATLKGAPDKTTQLAKYIIGSVPFLGGAMLLGSGRMTWSEPTDETQRVAKRAANIPPYAVKIGDTWVQYSKMHPSLSFPLAMVAALDDAVKNKKLNDNWVDLILNSVSKFGNFMADQSYLKSIGDMLSAVKGNPDAVRRFVSNYPQQLVPFRAMGGWLSRLFDEYQRQANPDAGFIENQVQQFMLNNPFLSNKLQARTGPDGKPLKQPNRVLNAFSPVRIQKEDQSFAKIFDDMYRIQKLNRDYRAQSDAIKQQEADVVDRIESGQSVEDLQRSGAITEENVGRITKALEDRQLGLTDLDKSLRAKPTKVRATFILDELDKKQSDEEYNDYLDELVNKGIMTEAVAEEMVKQKETRKADKPQGLIKSLIPKVHAAGDYKEVERVQSLIPSKAKQKAEENIPLIIEALRQEGIYSPEVLAYALATVQHETAGTFDAIEEIGGKEQARRLGYGGGENYFGRGFIQLTHENNYRDIGERIGLGDQLVKNPSLALRPDIAAKILAAFFKDRGVAELAQKRDFTAARSPVNGTDRQYEIARLAYNYLRQLEE